MMLEVSTPDLTATRTPPAAAWIGAGVVLALLLTAAAIAGQGLGRHGIELGLRLTARLAFLPFWPAYAAGALVTLFGPRFSPVKRRARELGLAFVAVLAVHLGLVSALCAIGAAPSAHVFLIFGPGAACTLLLAAASIEPVGQAIGPAGWWGLRNLAMNYLAFDFAVDFVRRRPPTSVAQALMYLPFAAFAVLGPALRLAAWIKLRVRPAP
jgi:hypothetical protein